MKQPRHSLSVFAAVFAWAFSLGPGIAPVKSAAEPPSASAGVAALDRAIMTRTATDGKIYGENEIDPLIWQSSTYFLSGESRLRLQAALKKVADISDAEVHRCPPAQRALVQNRVWAVFDHVRVHTEARTAADREYLRLLAQVMAKLALDKIEIAAITDPLAGAASSAQWPVEPTGTGGPDLFLPRGIAEQNGAWTDFGREGWTPTADNHAAAFGGRSLFVVRVRFPENSGTTPTAYFKTVADFPIPWVSNESKNVLLNPALPELPEHAEFALIRQLAVVDREGHWAATPLTVSVQLRHYRVTRREALEKLMALVTAPDDPGPFARLQSFAEFELETTAVAAGGVARMKPVRADDKRFRFLFAHDFDQVQPGFPDFPVGPRTTPLQECYMCHNYVGLQSINALFFEAGRTPPARSPRLVPLSAAGEAERIAWWKTQQVEWGALQAFWPAAETAAPVH